MMKFKELSNAYFDSKKITLANCTYYNQLRALQLHISPYFDDYDIDDITPLDVKKWQELMLKETYTQGTKQKNFSPVYLHDMHNILSQIFTYGCKFYGYQYNPAKECGNFKFSQSFTKRVTGDQFFTLDEFKQFISAVDDEEWNLIFCLLYFTGMRVGELRALKWKYINNEYITVKHSYDTKPDLTGKQKLKDPKNSYSIRQILLPKKLNDRLMTRRLEKTKKFGFSSEWYVFGDAMPISHTKIRYNKEKYCKKANVKSITLHGFRHSHVSLLLNTDKNVNLLTIANRMGHKDATRILKTYGHIFPEQEIELSGTLEYAEDFIENE